MRVEPSGITFEVRSDETLIEAAWRHGYTWPTVCAGKGTCRTCFVLVVDGSEALGPLGPLEHEGIEALRGVAPEPLELVRLACQLRVTGARAVVSKVGVQRMEGGLASTGSPAGSERSLPTRPAT